MFNLGLNWVLHLVVWYKPVSIYLMSGQKVHKLDLHFLLLNVVYINYQAERFEILVRTILCDEHNFPLGLTNLPNYGEDQSLGMGTSMTFNIRVGPR